MSLWFKTVQSPFLKTVTSSSPLTIYMMSIYARSQRQPKQIFDSKSAMRAVVVAQLVEWSLPTP